MNSSMLSEGNSNNELLEYFLKLSKIFKNSNKDTMLFNTTDTLENKLKESEDLLKKFSSNNLKSMLSIHTDIYDKPDLIIDECFYFTCF
jgi:hypothetical protein